MSLLHLLLLLLLLLGVASALGRKSLLSFLRWLFNLHLLFHLFHLVVVYFAVAEGLLALLLLRGLLRSLGDGVDERCGLLDVALAVVELLVTSPTEVLGTDMAVVRLGALSVHCVGGVALRAPHALAQGQCQPLALSFVVYVADAHDAVLVVAYQAVGHPLLLVHELKITLANAAD